MLCSSRFWQFKILAVQDLAVQDLEAQDSWKAMTFGNSDSERMRWSTSIPSASICVRNALNRVSGGTLSLSTQASAIASGVTRSIQATLSPNALAPQASQGLEETNSTFAGATPSFSLISV